jgi:hypothetical protein
LDYPHPIGERRDVPPIDMDLESTTFVPAGVIKIGVESRTITTDIIRQNYVNASAEVRARIESEIARLPGGVPFDDGGPSIHVCDAETGHEYLRFDPFPNEPHYHYIHPDRSHVRVQIDQNALGTAMQWALDTIARRTPQMLTAAGAPAELVDQLDIEAVRAAMPRVRELIGA